MQPLVLQESACEHWDFRGCFDRALLERRGADKVSLWVTFCIVLQQLSLNTKKLKNLILTLLALQANSHQFQQTNVKSCIYC